MTPTRLIILAVLFYILYRLLRGPRRKVEERGGGGAAGREEAGGQVQDILVEDPVCHTYIPKGQSVQLHHDKKMYYFCSNKCCKEFLKQKGADE